MHLNSCAWAFHPTCARSTPLFRHPARRHPKPPPRRAARFQFPVPLIFVQQSAKNHLYENLYVKIGYARVSTLDQNLSLQTDALKAKELNISKATLYRYLRYRDVKIGP